MCKLNISDLIISGKNVPIKIADKILEYHIRPMEEIQRLHEGIITCSQRSGYRSPIYEKKKGRSIIGQHCFIDKGATDWTTTGDLNDLFDLMTEHSGYTRLCIYQKSYFIHGDYAKTDGFVHLYMIKRLQKKNGDYYWDWVKFNQVPINRHRCIESDGT